MVIQKPQQVKAANLDLSAEIMDAAGNSQKTFHIGSGMAGAFDLPVKVEGGGVTNISIYIYYRTDKRSSGIFFEKDICRSGNGSKWKFLSC